jgi:hypothetical protein
MMYSSLYDDSVKMSSGYLMMTNFLAVGIMPDSTLMKYTPGETPSPSIKSITIPTP